MTYLLNIIFTNTLCLFIAGSFGLFFVARSKFYYIIAFEIMFLAINLNFFIFSVILNSISGVIFLLFIIIVSAIEVVIILSFFILIFKHNVFFDFKQNFKNIKN